MSRARQPVRIAGGRRDARPIRGCSMPRAAKKTSKPCTGPACAKPAGKTASGRKSKSKTGDPACSAAMSAWVTTRKSGATPAGVQAILGKCRSMARQRRMGEMHAAAGNTAKAQHIEHRLSKGVNGPVTQAERTARAKELLAQRAMKQAPPKAAPVKQATAESIMSRSTSSVVASAKVKRVADAAADMSEASPSGRVMIRDLRARFPGMGKAEFDKTLLAAHASKRHEIVLMKADVPQLAKEHEADAIKLPGGSPKHILYAGGRYRTPDKPKAVEKPPEKPAGGFSLAQQSAVGKKAADRFESSGGRTGTMFDMKKGDLKGQTTLMERFGTVHTHEGTGKQVQRLQQGHGKAEAAPLKKQTDPRKLLADQRSATADKLKTFRASELEQKHPDQFGKVGKTYDVATDKIKFDPERFQYKLAAQGSHGVTSALGDVKKYDPELAGTISVWRDPKDGKTYVVNGHHRLDLANKLGVKNVSARFIEAKDAGEARAKGAIVNIAEGRGSAVDAAKFFRETGHDAEALRSKGVSLREHTANQGLAMAGLSDRAFKKTVEGDLSTNRAAIIGGSGLTHPQQDQLLSVLAKPKNAKLTDGTVRNMAEAAKSAGSRTKTTTDLFGSNDHEESLFVHRARVEDKIARDLSGDKKLFGLVSKSKAAEKLAERGRSTIDTAETGKVSDEAAAVLGAFAQLKNRHPKVSRILNHAAEQLADGKPEREVVRETRTKVTSALKQILEGNDPFGD